MRASSEAGVARERPSPFWQGIAAMDPLRAFSSTEIAMLFVLIVTISLVFAVSAFVVEEEGNEITGADIQKQ